MIQSQANISSMEKPKRKFLLLVIFFVMLVIAMSVAGYFYFQNMQLKKNPQVLAEKEVKQLVDKVGHLIVLPEGETPTVATVNDPELLKDQSFFANAKAGDQVLIYTNAKKAIMYRPSTNQIVEVAPLNIGNDSSSSPITTTPKK